MNNPFITVIRIDNIAYVILFEGGLFGILQHVVEETVYNHFELSRIRTLYKPG
jgi:hypothetical protein